MAARQSRFPNINSAYVGLVEETGSLFVMSPDHFPLVVFGGADDRHKSIDSSPNAVVPQGPISSAYLRALCRSGSADRHCATGVRPLEGDSHLARLLDGAPTVALPPTANTDTQELENGSVSASVDRGNRSLLHSWPWIITGQQQTIIGVAPPARSPMAVLTIALCLTLGSVVFWVSRRGGTPTWKVSETTRPNGKTNSDSMTAYSEASPTTSTARELPDVPNRHSRLPNGMHSSISASTSELQLESEKAVASLPPTSGAPKFSHVPVEPPDHLGDDESEKEGDTAATPGKRKPLRRRRGKRKKNSVKDAGAEEGDWEEVEKPDTQNHTADTRVPEAAVELVSIAKPSMVVQPASKSPSTPSLIVSDTVLGPFIFISVLCSRLIGYYQVSGHMVRLCTRALYKDVPWPSNGYCKILSHLLREK